MPKIDIHTHILLKDWPDFNKKFGYDGFLRFEQDGCNGKMLWADGRLMRNVNQNSWEASERIKECDNFDVSCQVLSVPPALFSYFAKPEHGLHISELINDSIGELAASHPKRFLALANLPLQAPKLAVKEIERASKKVHGFQIGTHVNEWNLDAEELRPVFEALNDKKAAVFVHPWDMVGSDQMPKYWLPWLVGMPAESSRAICSLIFGGVFKRYPNIRFAFAHGGGAFPGSFGRIEQGFKARPDLCATEDKSGPRAYLGKFFVDSLVFTPEMLELCVSLFGEDSLCLGSDYPFPLGEEKPGALIESMKWEKARKEKLLYKNALKWLGRDKL